MWRDKLCFNRSSLCSLCSLGNSQNDSIYELRVTLRTIYLSKWWIYQFVTFKMFTFYSTLRKIFFAHLFGRTNYSKNDSTRVNDILNTITFFTNFLSIANELYYNRLWKIWYHDPYQFVTFKMSTHILFGAKWKKNTLGAFRANKLEKRFDSREIFWTRLHFFSGSIANELDYTRA